MRLPSFYHQLSVDSDYQFTNTHHPPSINPVRHPTLASVLLSILIPSALAGLILWPCALIFSTIPFASLVALPFLLALSIFLLFSLAWIPYLLFAQDDLTANSSPRLLLPFSPIKAQRVAITLIEHSVEFLKINWIELILDYSYRRLVVLGDRRRGHLPLLKPDIVYTEGRRCKRLDVYLPPPPPLRQEGDDSPLPLAPVLVFIHPGGWRWFRKAHFLQLGLRFRRLGFCVVIPDFTQFPEGRCEDSIIDIRGALNWVYNSISRHGGDPCRIFLAGHGSGAHLALLTVVQAAISRSASSGEGYEYGPVTGDGARAIPAVEAMVLLGGIFDPIKQLRDEARAGWHQISALRRALGPSHALTLAHSPAHLLHWAQSFLEPHFLPGKFLIVHGGRDENVSILQSQLLSTLLTAIDQRGGQPSADDEGSESSRSRSSLSVCFKAFKKLDHMGSLIGLMMADDRAGTEMSGYRRVIVEEILAMVGEGG